MKILNDTNYSIRKRIEWIKLALSKIDHTDKRVDGLLDELKRNIKILKSNKNV